MALQSSTQWAREENVTTIQTNDEIIHKPATQDEDAFTLSEAENEPNPFDINETDEEFKLSQAKEIDVELLAHQQQEDELIEQLYQQIHAMAFAPLKLKSKVENWKFIEDYYRIDDIRLKPKVAASVFKKVAEYNLFQQKQNNIFLIRAEIMQYFNSVFDWSSHWNEYQNQLPEHYFNVTLDIVDRPRKPLNVFTSLLTMFFFRSFAFLADVIIFVIFWFALIELLLPNFHNNSAVMVAGFVVYYFFI